MILCVFFSEAFTNISIFTKVINCYLIFNFKKIKILNIKSADNTHNIILPIIYTSCIKRF